VAKMKTKGKIYKIILSAFIITLLLTMPCSAFSLQNYSSNDTSIIMGPGESSFTIDVEIDVNKEFASAEFDITVSDKNELKAENISFDSSVSKANGKVETISSGGKVNGLEIIYKAGFLSTENQFRGKIKVGTLSFSYTGVNHQTITLDNLKIVSFTGNVKDNLPELEESIESWSKTITVSRSLENLKVEAPKANPAPGKYALNTEIQLSSDTEGAKIYYTLDGSNPTKSSTLYSQPIKLNKDMTIKAFAVKDGYENSSIATFVYTVASGGGSGSGGSNPSNPNQPSSGQPTEEQVKEPEKIHFEDVKENDWFYSAVQFVTGKGLMKGTSTNPMLFSPNATTTRGMVVTILYRMAGSPAVTATNPFSDVEAGQYYADAVIWASTNNIVSGYGNGIFGPNNSITREQMAVILMNYAKFKGIDVSARANISSFNDHTSVSQWAVDAISWANAKGLIQGSNNSLMPSGNAERCQVAAILQRFIELFE
jgi:hypothetical protein